MVPAQSTRLLREGEWDRFFSCRRNANQPSGADAQADCATLFVFSAFEDPEGCRADRVTRLGLNTLV